MNYRPRVIEGSIIDLPIDPKLRLKWVTYTTSGKGKPIKPQPKAIQQDERPRDLGEERHHQLLSALKGLKVNQTVNQSANVEEALKQNRDWR